MRQEITKETEKGSRPARTLLRALSLPLRSCCCPSSIVLLNRSNKPRPLRRIAARERRHSRITRLVESPLAGIASFLSRRQQVQPVLILPIMALAPAYHGGVETIASPGARTSVLGSSEVVRQAYGYGLFTGHVELVMKRAAMLL
jgi:hypothetical protein